jgi:hypothetical protein
MMFKGEQSPFFNMWKLPFIICVLISLSSSGAVIVMPRVDATIFVNKGKTDFESIFNSDLALTKEKVKWLFDNNRLDHDYSKAVDTSLNFEPYWNHFSEMWHLVDMDVDGNPELIFSGKPLVSDEKERFSIFARYGSIWKEVFWDDGHLLAYKKHPRTGEIILFHHRYPCCSQFTHLIQRVRWLNNKMHLTQRYFLARDTGMKGQFFPASSTYPNSYKRLKKTKMLYWSKGKIAGQAAQFSPTNEIIHFPAQSLYQVLAKEGSWLYVMMVSPPIIEESLVANANNLQACRFYGWISP